MQLRLASVADGSKPRLLTKTPRCVSVKDILPKITIKYNRFLDPIFIGWIQSQEKYKDWQVPDKAVVLERVKNYNLLWERYGERILTAITDVTGLSFKRNLIPIYIVSGNPRGFSDPVVLKSGYSDMEFINCLAHELIHCLFTDNYSRVNDAIPYAAPGFNSTAEDHVFLQAILKYLYVDVLGEPERLVNEMKRSNKYRNGYELAWQVVESRGYRLLIEEFKTKIKKE